MRNTMWIALALSLGLCTVAQAAPRAKAVAAKVNDETTTEINDALAIVNLHGIWFFHEGDEPMFARPTFDDRSWTPKRIPTDRTSWDKRWQGYGWYRRHLYMNPRALGQNLELSLGPAREVVDVYLNGVLVMQRGRFGSRLHGDARVTPLRAIIPASLFVAGENVLAVRVFDPSYTCGLPSGPLLLGPPADVEDRVMGRGTLAMGLRIVLALMAFCIALAQVAVNVRRATAHGEHRWAALAGISLAIAPLSGTGVLTSLLPSLDLALRLPAVMQAMALMFLFNYFATRYDDYGSNRSRLGVFTLTLLTAFIFLAPNDWMYFAADPAMWVLSLLTTLYAAHLLSQALRRQEESALLMFVTLIAHAGLLVYDGLVVTSSDTIPPLGLFGAVGVLMMASVVGARDSLQNHRKTLLTMLTLRKELEARVWMDILQATVDSISRPQEYLDAVAHEIAREMGVRRCSIILPDSKGQLYIVASKGLPRQARHAPLQTTRSIARHVYETGVALSPATLPADLQRKPEDAALRGNYDTQGFVVSPIRGASRTLGVLNVTDLNDGGVFNTADEAHVALLCDRLALVLSRLQLTADVILRQAMNHLVEKPTVIKLVEVEPEPLATRISSEDDASSVTVIAPAPGTRTPTPALTAPVASAPVATRPGATAAVSASGQVDPNTGVRRPSVDAQGQVDPVTGVGPVPAGHDEPEVALDDETVARQSPLDKSLS